jgi:uncharacterized protein (TIGR03435 family)
VRKNLLAIAEGAFMNPKLFLVSVATVVTVASAALVLPAEAQTPSSQEKPSFEVVSVKPNKSGPVRGSFNPRADRFIETNVTVRQLIQDAYRRRAFDTRQIVGGPSWIDSDRFDLVAKIEDGAGSLLALYVPDGKGSPGLAYRMVRTLLEDRFKLAVHTEVRTMPIYALVIARSDGKIGPKLLRSDVDCDQVLKEQADAVLKTGRLPPPLPGQGPPCSTGGPPGKFRGNDVTMQMFADVLTASVNRGGVSSSVNRVVVDRTGLAGNFNLSLEWTPDEMAQDFSGGSIFTALQEQLGLKLEPTRGPVDALVIDHVEQPTPD